MKSVHETTARKFYDTFNRRDYKAIGDVCDTKCVITDMATGTQLKGLDGAKSWLQFWATMSSDMKADIEVVSASDTCVVIEGNARGLNDGSITLPSGTLPASKKKLHMQWVDIIEFKDNKIASVRCYYDMVRMLNQLGVTQLPQNYKPMAHGAAH